MRNENNNRKKGSAGTGKSFYNFDLRYLLSEAEEKQSEAKSTRRIALVLSCICNGFNTPVDIAEHSRLSRSTVHRLLKGMERAHLVVFDPVSRRCFLGSLFRHLISNPEVTHEYMVSRAGREMERLAEVVDETIILGVMIGLNHVTLHTIPSSHDLRVVGPSKYFGPLHVGAPGKVLLSQLNEKELQEAIKNIDFAEDAAAGSTDLLAQITQIRRKGYAVTAGERIVGATSIAAPIFGYSTPAELCIIGPDVRVQPQLEKCIKQLLAATDRISRNLAEK